MSKSVLRQGLTHARYQFTDMIRSPLTIFLGLGMPLITFLFFVFPRADIMERPKIVASALVALAIFGMMSNSIIGFAAEISVNREKGWSDYLTALPGSSASRIIGYIISLGALAALSMVPLTVFVVSVAKVGIEPARWLPAVLALIVTSIPFMLIGVSIGFLFSARSAAALAQVLMLTLAFAGGLFIPPVSMADWLNNLSKFLPTRSTLEINLWVAVGDELKWEFIVGWIAWVVIGLLGVVYTARRRAKISA